MVEMAWSDLPDPEFASKPAAITIGVFDGLHAGHQRLLSSTTRDPALLPVVVTFQRHPTEILAAGSFPGFIMSLAQKRKALRDAGIGVVVLIDFSLEFSRLAASEFLDTLLESFDFRFAGIGHDFRCGHGMAMDGAAMRDYLGPHGVEVELVSAVRHDGPIVSSTLIRDLIRRGELNAANEMLGRPFALDVSGETVERDGDEVWISLDDRGLLPESQQILPPPGEYPAIVEGDGFSTAAPLRIGMNSVRLPLAPGSRIRYIVVQENRVLDKE